MNDVLPVVVGARLVTVGNFWVIQVALLHPMSGIITFVHLVLPDEFGEPL